MLPGVKTLPVYAGFMHDTKRYNVPTPLLTVRVCRQMKTKQQILPFSVHKNAESEKVLSV